MEQPRPKTILVVDDDASVRKLLRRFLTAAGYAMSEAGDGITGLKIAKQLIPDLVVIDVLMPDMNGYELCALLKQDAATAPIPVLFLTGQGKMGDVEDAMAQGADVFMTKPVDFPRFMKHVKAMVEKE